MKKSILTLALTVLFSASALANPIDGEKKEINAEKSNVTWKAYKVTGSHTGTINIKSGMLEFDGTKLTGGEFVIDMTSINTTDLEGGAKNKLDGHLHSDDFFGTASNPTSKLKFTSVKASGKNSYEVTGDLTVKGITKPVTFDISVYGSKATASLKIDRTAYNIKYGSTLIGAAADKAIYDEFDIVPELEF